MNGDRRFEPNVLDTESEDFLAGKGRK